MKKALIFILTVSLLVFSASVSGCSADVAPSATTPLPSDPAPAETSEPKHSESLSPVEDIQPTEDISDTPVPPSLSDAERNTEAQYIIDETNVLSQVEKDMLMTYNALWSQKYNTRIGVYLWAGNWEDDSDVVQQSIYAYYGNGFSGNDILIGVDMSDNSHIVLTDIFAENDSVTFAEFEPQCAEEICMALVEFFEAAANYFPERAEAERANRVYVYDEVNALSADEESQISNFCLSLDRDEGLIIYFAIIDGFSEGITSIVDQADHMRAKLEVNTKEMLVIVDVSTHTSIITYGTNKTLVNAGVAITVSDSVGAAIIKYCQGVIAYLKNEYLQLGNQISSNFESYISNIGFLLADVTDMNIDTYPDSTVVQAGDGHIDIYCLNGSENDAGLLWSYYYEKCFDYAPIGTFVQKWDPDNASAPCSVEGVVDGQYIRAELVGNTCVVAMTNEPALAETIGSIMTGIGVPENTAKVS